MGILIVLILIIIVLLLFVLIGGIWGFVAVALFGACVGLIIYLLRRLFGG